MPFNSNGTKGQADYLIRPSEYMWQVYEYLHLSVFKYTYDSTCTLLKYWLIPAGVLVFIPKYHAEYLCVLVLVL